MILSFWPILTLGHPNSWSDGLHSGISIKRYPSQFLRQVTFDVKSGTDMALTASRSSVFSVFSSTALFPFGGLALDSIASMSWYIRDVDSVTYTLAVYNRKAKQLVPSNDTISLYSSIPKNKTKLQVSHIYRWSSFKRKSMFRFHNSFMYIMFSNIPIQAVNMSSLYHLDPVVVSFQVSQIPMITIHSWFISHSLMSHHHHHTRITYNDTIYSKQIKPQWAYSTPYSALRPSLYTTSLSLSLTLYLCLFVGKHTIYILHYILYSAQPGNPELTGTMDL